MRHLSFYRDCDGEMFLTPGCGRSLLHPDDCVDCLTECHAFTGRGCVRAAQAFIEGIQMFEGVEARLLSRSVVLVEFSYKPHVGREILVTEHRQ
jgi:hypothetical protein